MNLPFDFGRQREKMLNLLSVKKTNNYKTGHKTFASEILEGSKQFEFRTKLSFVLKYHDLLNFLSDLATISLFKKNYFLLCCQCKTKDFLIF